MARFIEVTVDAQLAGLRLDQVLVRCVPGLSRAKARRLFAAGRVYVAAPEGRRRRAAKGDTARRGQVLTVQPTPDESAGAQRGPGEAPDAAVGGGAAEPHRSLRIVLETPLLVVVDKPAGQPTARLPAGQRATVADDLVRRYPEMAEVGFSTREPGLCHRLDSDTSGLVLAARTAAAFGRLVAALKAHRLEKRYLLICSSAGLSDQGQIDIPLAPHPKNRRKVLACVYPRDAARHGGRPAVTDYRVQERQGGRALVQARAPRASRHQIRAHFSAIGHPIEGDVLYGAGPVPSAGLHRLALHASYIGFAGDDLIAAFEAHSALPTELCELLAPSSSA